MKKVSLLVAGLFMVMLLMFANNVLLSNENQDMRNLFEQKYKEWKDWVEKHRVLSTYVGNEKFYE
ncbi:MAG: hypothetical protein AB1599_04120, partial [Planctomycetota bacterium]